MTAPATTPDLSPDAKRRLLAWALSDDTGISSRAIAMAAAGLPVCPYWGACPPADNADFGRCFRLLQAVPEVRDALPALVAQSPKWGPLVERWHELEAAYVRDKLAASRSRSECHDLIRAIRDGAPEDRCPF
jgi:hypothetical protein